MPITRSDQISGTIYVIATDAETAQRKALDYLQDGSEDREHNHYGVYDQRDAADKELYNKFSSYDTDRDHVYAVSLDVRIATE